MKEFCLEFVELAILVAYFIYLYLDIFSPLAKMYCICSYGVKLSRVIIHTRKNDYNIF